MMKNIETKWLYDFLALEDSRNFTLAAESCNISQSAFSRRIRSLEEAIGFDLFDRNSSPLSLTEKGRVFHSKIRNMLDELEYSLSTLQGGSNVKSQVKIASAHSLSIYIIPALFKLIPDIKNMVFFVEAIDVNDTIISLKEGKSDFIFSFYDEMLMSGQFQQLKILESHLYPICALNQQGEPAFSFEQDSIPLLNYTDRSYMGRKVDQYLSRNNPEKFNTIFVSSMSGLLKRMVLQGQGVAWLPDYSIEQELADNKLCILPNCNAVITMEVYAYRLNSKLNLPSERLWSFIKSECCKIL
ncbi:hypochlorite stress DNA-binding transcriptional regulator HypT [Serratia sp. L9]|uniref:hypochlorite stress DNA-binding transcriptional regulator HypT n=1 Tax=Serratia sp. L9 TaxID=3423946 RepID=UPI003D675B1E